MKTEKHDQWFKVVVTLTEDGASKFRSDGIAAIGSKGLDGHQALVLKKEALQAAKPEDFTTQEFKVRGDDMDWMMGSLTQKLQVGWHHIANIAVFQTE